MSSWSESHNGDDQVVLGQRNFGGIPSTVRLQRLDREAREERARCAALLVRTRVLAGITARALLLRSVRFKSLLSRVRGHRRGRILLRSHLVTARAFCQRLWHGLPSYVRSSLRLSGLQPCIQIPLAFSDYRAALHLKPVDAMRDPRAPSELRGRSNKTPCSASLK